MSAPHTHFSSPTRVLKRRKEALARLPKVASPLSRDKRVKKNPRTQEVLDAERARLIELASGNYQKPTFKKAFHVGN